VTGPYWRARLFAEELKMIVEDEPITTPDLMQAFAAQMAPPVS
jgi:hypothetical protein